MADEHRARKRRSEEQPGAGEGVSHPSQAPSPNAHPASPFVMPSRQRSFNDSNPAGTMVQRFDHSSSGAGPSSIARTNSWKLRSFSPGPHAADSPGTPRTGGGAPQPPPFLASRSGLSSNLSRNASLELEHEQEHEQYHDSGDGDNVSIDRFSDGSRSGNDDETGSPEGSGGAWRATRNAKDRWQSLKGHVRTRLLQRSNLSLSHGAGEDQPPPPDAATSGGPGAGWRRLLRARTRDLMGEPEFVVAASVATVVDKRGAKAEVVVLRESGGSNVATVRYETRDVHHGARAGTDYEETAGELRFEAGQYSRTVEIPIKPNSMYHGARSFEVVLTSVDGGALGATSRCTVTILETDLRIYLRILNSRWFQLLTFMATAFTLIGANISMIYLNKEYDLAISGVAIGCMVVFFVEMWALSWVKRWTYVFTTIFWMDCVALVGLFFFLPILPRLEWGNWLGATNFSILVVARAARAARTGSQLGHAIPVIVSAAKYWFLRPVWRLIARVAPQKVAEQMAKDSDSEGDILEDMMGGEEARNLRAEVGRNRGEVKGAKELLAALLPSSSTIGVAVVEFVVGRLILMMMVLLLVAIVLLQQSTTQLQVHNGALARAALLSNGTESAEMDSIIALYAAYVRTQGQALVYLRVKGRDISAAEVERLTCNYASVYPERLGRVRNWWMFVVAPKAAGINGVTFRNPRQAPSQNDSSCALAGEESINTSGFRCSKDPKVAFSSSRAVCDTLAIVDNTKELHGLYSDNLLLTVALVGILGVGAAIVAADVQSMLLSPLVRLFSVFKLLLGNEDPHAKRRRQKQEKKDQKRRVKGEKGRAAKDRGKEEDAQRKGPKDDGEGPGAGAAAGSGTTQRRGDVPDAPAESGPPHVWDSRGIYGARSNSSRKGRDGAPPGVVSALQGDDGRKRTFQAPGAKFPPSAGQGGSQGAGTRTGASYSQESARGSWLATQRDGSWGGSRRITVGGEMGLSAIQEDGATTGRDAYGGEVGFSRRLLGATPMPGGLKARPAVLAPGATRHLALPWRRRAAHNGGGGNPFPRSSTSGGSWSSGGPPRSRQLSKRSAALELAEVQKPALSRLQGTTKLPQAGAGGEDAGNDGDKEELGSNCPGSPPWAGWAHDEGEREESESLLASLWERLHRLMSIGVKDIRKIERELDKVERAFGWQLVEVRQWARDVIMWTDMATGMAASLTRSFADQSLTLGELRNKVALLYESVKLPAWASKSVELRIAARVTSVVGGLLGEYITILQEKLLAVLKHFGLAVDDKEAISVAMLSRVIVAAVLRYQLLNNIGERKPENFSDYSLLQLWEFAGQLVLRKVAQHLAAQGIAVHPSFYSLPLHRLWAAVTRLKTHALYHRLRASGLRLAKSAALATNKGELRKHAKNAFAKSIRAVVEAYSLNDVHLRLSAPAAVLAREEVSVVLGNVPLVAGPLRDAQHMREKLPGMWEATLGPVLRLVEAFLEEVAAETNLLEGEETTASSEGVHLLQRVCRALYAEREVLWAWSQEEVAAPLPLATPAPAPARGRRSLVPQHINGSAKLDAVGGPWPEGPQHSVRRGRVGVALESLQEGADFVQAAEAGAAFVNHQEGGSTMPEPSGRPWEGGRESRPFDRTLAMTPRETSASRLGGGRRANRQLGELRRRLLEAVEQGLGGGQRQGLAIGTEEWELVCCLVLGPIVDSSEGLLVATARQKLQRAVACEPPLHHPGRSAGKEPAWAPSQGSCSRQDGSSGHKEEEYGGSYGVDLSPGASHGQRERAGELGEGNSGGVSVQSLEALMVEVTAAVRGEILLAFGERGLLVELPPGISGHLDLDSELRLGLTSALGNPLHYRSITTRVVQMPPQEAADILQQAGTLLDPGAGPVTTHEKVEASLRTWMAAGLANRGIETPTALDELPLEEAAELAEILLLERARLQLAAMGLVQSSSHEIAEAGDGGGEPESHSSFDRLRSEAEAAVYREAVGRVKRFCAAVVPSFPPSDWQVGISKEVAREDREEDAGKDDELRQHALVFPEWERAFADTADPAEAQPFESLVKAVGSAIEEVLVTAVEMSVMEPGELQEERSLVGLLDWLGGLSTAAAKVQAGSVAASVEGLQSQLADLLDERLAQQGDDMWVLVTAKSLHELHMALDSLVVQWANSELQGMLPSSPLDGPLSANSDSSEVKGTTGLGQVARLALELQSKPRLAALHALRSLTAASPGSGEALSLQELIRKEVKVLFGDLPEVAALLEAMALLPSGEEDGDDLRRFILKSGYPTKWQAFLPQVAHLAPLEDVLQSPKASLAIIIAQVIIHVAIVGQDRHTPSFFDATGALGRGLLGFCQHVASMYKDTADQPSRL